VPRVLYTDWKNVYKRKATGAEQMRGKIPVTQFGRMCQKLGIRIIAASTPQANAMGEAGIDSPRKPFLCAKTRPIYYSCPNDGNPARGHYVSSNVELCQGRESAGLNTTYLTSCALDSASGP
jgi:hypothetical protein